MIDLLPPELGDDSEDFSDAEVAQAIAMPNADRMISHLRNVRCPECSTPIEVGSHALRRRAPFFYGRMVARCIDHHEHTIIFRLDWMQPGSS